MSRGRGPAGRAGQPGPVAILGFGYSGRAPALAWALAGTGVQVLVRLGDGGRRVFYAAAPAREPGSPGRPPRQGRWFTLAQAGGWPPADLVQIVAGSGRHGRVEVRAWHGLHQRLHGRGHFGNRPQPAVPGTVIQVTAERLPGGRVPDGPLWLWRPARPASGVTWT